MLLGHRPSPTVFISDRAFSEIVAETLENVRTETGGVLLGARESGNWYVVDSLDPGPGAVLQHAYFEYNHEYLTHLSNKVARRYRSRLRLLGLWHRHPGSLDTFSSVDDGTNFRYASELDGSAISGLINLDPDFRMTFYLVELVEARRPVQYTRLETRVGDSHFPAGILDTWDGESRLRQARIGQRPERRFLAPAPVETRAPEIVLEPPADGFEQNRRPQAAARRQERGCLGLFFGAPRRHPSRNPARATDERLGRVPYPESQPSSLAPPSDTVLDMIDSELGYLERQDLYNYEIHPVNGRVRLLMTLSAPVHGYPRRIEFWLQEEEGERFVVFQDQRRQFQPGFVQKTVDRFGSPAASIEPEVIS